MRIFIAIPVDENLKKSILSVQDRLSVSDASIKFVEEENLHFTIKFLGEVTEDVLEKIKNVLKEESEKFESFEIKIAGIGCFPSKNYIRVVWLGVKDGQQTFSALLRSIDDGLVNLGFDREVGYTPHLTLGRVRSIRAKEKLSSVLASLEDVEIGNMKVNKIELFESILKRTGPEYRELFTVNLK